MTKPGSTEPTPFSTPVQHSSTHPYATVHSTVCAIDRVNQSNVVVVLVVVVVAVFENCAYPSVRETGRSRKMWPLVSHRHSDAAVGGTGPKSIARLILQLLRTVYIGQKKRSDCGPNALNGIVTCNRLCFARFFLWVVLFVHGND